MTADRTNDQERAGVTLDQLHDQLRAAVRAIETGDQWRTWLDFASRLHRYSFDNLMLIMAQRPDATAVASYTTWKSIDRQVLRGERSIKVLAPISRRKEITDDQGQPVLDSDGRKQFRRSVVGYRPVSVFDIKQTSGSPLPGPVLPTLLEGTAPAGLWDALEREVSERGYRLLRAGSDELGGANGVTMPGRREVWVRDDVDDAQAVKTLTHELAHILLHTGEDPAADPCRGIKEVEAESVAYLTLASHGVATGTYSFPYVAHWAFTLAEAEHVEMTDIVARTGRRVMEAARTIIEATKPTDVVEPATVALAVRANRAADETAALREEAAVRTQPRVDRAVLVGVVADSQDFFRAQVHKSWVPEYLRSRNLAKAIDSHGIGYAPQSWTALTDHLRSLGYTDDHIQAAGMATRARTGNLIDRFRDRMTIPLQDRDGDLVGFTARSAPEAGAMPPKYLNSPASPIFTKGEIVYGLSDLSDRADAGCLPVVCEGALDAIAINIAGYTTNNRFHGLATSGTAFTDAHARQIVAVTAQEGICLAYDGDEAGSAAAEHAWTKITNAGTYNIAIAELPADTDPASLNADGAGLLADRLRGARNGAYVLVDRRIDAAHIVDNLPRQYALFHDLVDWAAQLPANQRVDLAIHAARRLGIHPDDAATELTKAHPGFMAESLGSVLQHCDAVTAQLDTQARADERREVGSPGHMLSRNPQPVRTQS